MVQRGVAVGSRAIHIGVEVLDEILTAASMPSRAKRCALAASLRRSRPRSRVQRRDVGARGRVSPADPSGPSVVRRCAVPPCEAIVLCRLRWSGSPGRRRARPTASSRRCRWRRRPPERRRTRFLEAQQVEVVLRVPDLPPHACVRIGALVEQRRHQIEVRRLLLLQVRPRCG